jgi:hypothetical protein
MVSVIWGRHYLASHQQAELEAEAAATRRMHDWINELK